MRTDEEKRQAIETLRLSVIEGFDAVERGEGVDLTGELWDVLIVEAEEDARRGSAPDPDVVDPAEWSSWKS
jgi:hypothetical protein